MRIAVLDPGLEKGTGHHGDIDLRLAQHWIAQGHEVEFFGRTTLSLEFEQRAIAASIRVNRTFRMSPYDAPTAGTNPYAFIRQLVSTLAEDLRPVPPAAVEFWPTATPTQLIAHALSPQLGAPIAGLFYPPTFGTIVNPTLWHSAEQMLKTAGRALRLGVYDSDMVDLYRTLIARDRVFHLPFPTAAKPRPFPRARTQRVGFFGSQRNERGMELIPELVRRLAGQGFEVVLHDSQCRFATEAGPKVHVLGLLPDLAPEMAACDLIIWPSQAQFYQRRISAILSEALAAGIPVVAPACCRSSEIAASFDCGVFFHEYTIEAILQAVASADANYDRLNANAAAAARIWQQTEGVGRTANAVLQLAGLR